MSLLSPYGRIKSELTESTARVAGLTTTSLTSGIATGLLTTEACSTVAGAAANGTAGAVTGNVSDLSALVTFSTGSTSAALESTGLRCGVGVGTFAGEMA